MLTWYYPAFTIQKQDKLLGYDAKSSLFVHTSANLKQKSAYLLQGHCKYIRKEIAQIDNIGKHCGETGKPGCTTLVSYVLKVYRLELAIHKQRNEITRDLVDPKELRKVKRKASTFAGLSLIKQFKTIVGRSLLWIRAFANAFGNQRCCAGFARRYSTFY